MGRLLHKLRGLAGLCAMWGSAWALVGAVIGVVVGLVSGSWRWANPVLEWALGMGLYGAVSGLGFGTLLALRERRKTLMQLSLPRVAAWGILGGAAVPLLFGALGTFEPSTTAADVLGAVLVTAGLGGAFSSGSLAIARRAERRALESGEGSSDRLSPHV